MSKKQNEVMGSTGIRFSQDQLDRCDAKSRELGISRNEFVREAVEFYLEWLSRECTGKFLTPALESVFSAKLRDTEDRLARILFKIPEVFLRRPKGEEKPPLGGGEGVGQPMQREQGV